MSNTILAKNVFTIENAYNDSKEDSMEKDVMTPASLSDTVE